MVSDGAGAPVITDGPFPESKELLAGYRLIDVETADRALEIAARASAAPGPNGALLDGLDDRLGAHHRLHSVRAHLLEQAGDVDGAAAEFRAAAARATNLRERQYLTTQAARLAGRADPS